MDDFGPQGGDPARGVRMDLSTCVNRYGPPPAALEALRSIEARDILLHPYDAPGQLKALYTWAVGVDGDDMLAGRGPASSSGPWAATSTTRPSQCPCPATPTT